MAENAQQLPKSAKTVTVGCKLPNGHIMQLQKQFDEVEITPNGNRQIKVWRFVNDQVRVNGCAVAIDRPARHTIIGGYGLTPGVNAEFAEQWFEQNQHSEIVKRGLIFIAATRDAAERKAEEQVELRSGLEPLDTSVTVRRDGRVVPNDPRYPRSVNANLTEIHQADRRAD